VDEAEVGADAAGADRHPERVCDHRRPHVGGDLEADQLAREGVEHERQVGDPCQLRRCVMSASQSRFGASAEKSRSTRSGFEAASGSGRVVRQGRPRRLAPSIPLSRISRSTVQRAHPMSRRRSSFHVRRDEP